MTREEYNKCVDKYSDSVFRFILKNIKCQDKANDIVQDTFEKLWINRKNVNFATSKSYIFTTAYHTMIDLIRKEKHTTEIDTNTEDYHYEGTYSDVKEILNKAIEKLPADQKSVLLLRDYEGYSYKEISQITGLSESQVKVYIFRARVFLKKFIGSIDILV